MSAHAEKGVPRQVLLARLQKQIQEQGGSAFLALSASSHPVLCVGAGDCRTSLVVVEDNAGEQWFIWGRTGSAHVSQIDHAATVLCNTNPRPARPTAAARRTGGRGAA
ncbi:MAG: hypothetical protein PUE00_11655 [Thermobifida fusca]|nr:hypothetical protein [Thermobifida fusca]